MVFLSYRGNVTGLFGERKDAAPYREILWYLCLEEACKGQDSNAGGRRIPVYDWPPGIRVRRGGQRRGFRVSYVPKT